MTKLAYNRTALVLSGCGARAAYEAGVLKALRELSPLPEASPFSIYCGMSGGAINVAMLALAQENFAAGIDGLVDFWSRIRVDRVCATAALADNLGDRLRGSAPQTLFDASPLAGSLSELLDFRRLEAAIGRQAIRALCVTCSGYVSGQSVSFFQGRPDIEPWQDRQRVGAHVKLGAIHVAASMAMPFLFPPVKLHREYFADGSVRNPSPLAPAVRLGADRILAIGSGRAGARDPRADAEHPDPPGSSGLGPAYADIAGHLFAGCSSDNLGEDAARMESINRLLKVIPARIRQERGISRRPIRLLVIEPSEPLEAHAADCLGDLPRNFRQALSRLGADGDAGSVLTSCLLFEAGYTQRLMRTGYRDAMSRRREIRAFLGEESR